MELWEPVFIPSFVAQHSDLSQEEADVQFLKSLSKPGVKNTEYERCFFFHKKNMRADETAAFSLPEPP